MSSVNSAASIAAVFTWAQLIYFKIAISAWHQHFVGSNAQEAIAISIAKICPHRQNPVHLAIEAKCFKRKVYPRPHVPSMKRPFQVNVVKRGGSFPHACSQPSFSVRFEMPSVEPYIQFMVHGSFEIIIFP